MGIQTVGKEHTHTQRTETICAEVDWKSYSKYQVSVVAFSDVYTALLCSLSLCFQSAAEIHHLPNETRCHK